MPVRFVQWAPGVTVPEEFTQKQEMYVQRAYEEGFRQGKAAVQEPIIEALGLHERFED